MMKLENWLAFAGGMVVGGALLMLLAPKSRKEMCENVRRKIDEAKECVNDAMCKCHSHSCGCVENVPEKNESASAQE